MFTVCLLYYILCFNVFTLNIIINFPRFFLMHLINKPDTEYTGQVCEMIIKYDFLT